MGGILWGLQLSANQPHKAKGLFIPLFMHLESKGNSCPATHRDKSDHEHKCQILYKTHHQTPEILLMLSQESASVKHSEYLKHSETCLVHCRFRGLRETKWQQSLELSRCLQKPIAGCGVNHRLCVWAAVQPQVSSYFCKVSIRPNPCPKKFMFVLTQLVFGNDQMDGRKNWI